MPKPRLTHSAIKRHRCSFQFGAHVDNITVNSFEHVDWYICVESEDRARSALLGAGRCFPKVDIQLFQTIAEFLAQPRSPFLPSPLCRSERCKMASLFGLNPHHLNYFLFQCLSMSASCLCLFFCELSIVSLAHVPVALFVFLLLKCRGSLHILNPDP